MPTGEEIRLTKNVLCAFKFDHQTVDVWLDDNGNYNCVICAPQPPTEPEVESAP